MVYIDYAVIAESLSEFGYFMPESDALIDKGIIGVNSLATEFNLSVDDFVDELLASALNMKRSEVDLGILEHMEAELCKKLKKSLDSVLTPSSSRSKRTFGERNVDESSLSVSSMDVDTSVHEDFGSTQLTGKYRAFAPVASSPSNAKYQARMERNVVVREVQGQMFVSSSAVGSSIQITLLSSFEYVYGEIVRDLSEELPLSDQCVSVMMDDEAGTVVALLGSFENGDRFMANRQLFPNPLPLSAFERTANDENLCVWCACGPFTSNENCSYEQLCDLLDMVKQQQPHVLVLVNLYLNYFLSYEL
uniref:Tudor domain-containing protein n=1 Tax=Angiostrongylus cantonensis TaxID=6313 RepID=A0A0K0DH58_ANGCA